VIPSDIVIPGIWRAVYDGIYMLLITHNTRSWMMDEDLRCGYLLRSEIVTVTWRCASFGGFRITAALVVAGAGVFSTPMHG
jgi:tryptophan-rich sensory protein